MITNSINKQNRLGTAQPVFCFETRNGKSVKTIRIIPEQHPDALAQGLVLRQLQLSGIYAWIAILMTVCALFVKRLRKFLPCCLLLMMVLGACVLSPVNGYFRYIYPLVLCTPVVLTGVLGSIKKDQVR